MQICLCFVHRVSSPRPDVRLDWAYPPPPVVRHCFEHVVPALAAACATTGRAPAGVRRPPRPLVFVSTGPLVGGVGRRLREVPLPDSQSWISKPSEVSVLASCVAKTNSGWLPLLISQNSAPALPARLAATTDAMTDRPYGSCLYPLTASANSSIAGNRPLDCAVWISGCTPAAAPFGSLPPLVGVRGDVEARCAHRGWD